jgi:hypothetical protein
MCETIDMSLVQPVALETDVIEAESPLVGARDIGDRWEDLTRRIVIEDTGEADRLPFGNGYCCAMAGGFIDVIQCPEAVAPTERPTGRQLPDPVEVWR